MLDSACSFCTCSSNVPANATDGIIDAVRLARANMTICFLIRTFLTASCAKFMLSFSTRRRKFLLLWQTSSHHLVMSVVHMVMLFVRCSMAEPQMSFPRQRMAGRPLTAVMMAFLRVLRHWRRPAGYCGAGSVCQSAFDPCVPAWYLHPSAQLPVPISQASCCGNRACAAGR